MNYFILTAAILALMAVIGHLTIGRKEYLKPVLDSELDIIPKKIVQSLFHYMTVFMLFSTIILFAGSSQSCPLYDYVNNMIRFIAITYGLFALIQLIIVATSNISGGLLKLFQWIFWALISTFTILGTL